MLKNSNSEDSDFDSCNDFNGPLEQKCWYGARAICEYDVNDELETRLMKVLYSLRSSDSNTMHMPASFTRRNTYHVLTAGIVMDELFLPE